MVVETKSDLRVGGCLEGRRREVVSLTQYNTLYRQEINSGDFRKVSEVSGGVPGGPELYKIGIKNCSRGGRGAVR